MELIQFYRYYIPALEQALSEENINKPIYSIKDPTQFLVGDKNILREIDLFLDDNAGKNTFLDMVAYYFDAISHNFLTINNININDIRFLIWENIYDIKKRYDIN